MKNPTKHPLYFLWQAMIYRCTSKRSIGWRHYGGRGIKVCKRWMRLENFAADMGPRPSPDHTLDRKNNDGDYKPSNCRWATQEQQRSNMSRNNKVSFRGETKILTCWAKEIGVSRSSLAWRLARWPIDRALTEPAKPYKTRNRPLPAQATE